MRKNIYVRDEDTAIFDRAEQLGGESLSAVIADALRRYVAAEEAKGEGLQETVIEVGTRYGEGADDTRKIKFVGRKLADGRIYSTGDSRGTDYDLYFTQKGKILALIEHWSRWQGESTTADYKIYDTLEHTLSEGVVPGGIIQEAADTLDVELVEYLDV